MCMGSLKKPTRGDLSVGCFSDNEIELYILHDRECVRLAPSR